MTFPITTLAAGILGLLFALLTWRVVRARQTLSKVEGGADLIERRVRGHANFSEYVPMALILCALAEAASASQVTLIVGASLLVIGRLLHGYAFAFSTFSPIGRIGGTTLTLISVIILSVLVFVEGVMALGL